LTYILHVSTLSVNVYRKAARIFLPVFTDWQTEPIINKWLGS
jgi:hypothetical protein